MVCEKDSATSMIYADKNLADFFEECAKRLKDYAMISNWMLTHLLKCLNYNSVSIKNSKVSAEKFTDFLKSIKSGKITERLGKELIKELVSTGKTIEQLIKDKGVKELSINELEKAAREVLSRSEKAVSDYKSGNSQSFNYLLGETLKATKYHARVEDARKVLESLLK